MDSKSNVLQFPLAKGQVGRDKGQETSALPKPISNAAAAKPKAKRAIDWVAFVERENTKCGGCAGACSKEIDRWLQLVLIDGKAERALCKYGQARLFSGEFARAGIPEKFHSKTFLDYETLVSNNDAKAIARSILYAKNPKSGYFYGGVGTGKTFLAALVAQDFVRNFKTVRFLNQPTDAVADCELLVLDDIGTWTPIRLATILNHCYEKGQLFIATADCELDALELDAKTKSRLKATTAQALIGGKERLK